MRRLINDGKLSDTGSNPVGRAEPIRRDRWQSEAARQLCATVRICGICAVRPGTVRRPLRRIQTLACRLDRPTFQRQGEPLGRSKSCLLIAKKANSLEATPKREPDDGSSKQGGYECLSLLGRRWCWLLSPPANMPSLIKKTNLFVPNSGSLENHNGSMNMQDQTVHCGPSSYVSGIQAVGTDGSSMGMYLRYICRSIDGKNLTVKKTNPVDPDTGSRINGSNYGVSEPADGPIAGCPQGSFISGIGGFKYTLNSNLYPMDFHPISSIIYGCRSVVMVKLYMSEVYTPIGNVLLTMIGIVVLLITKDPLPDAQLIHL